MRRLLLVTAVFVAAAAVLVLVTIPPRRDALTSTWSDGTVAGALHIHTSRSDGRSAPDEVAAAAARAGLKFIVFTDHGDATRKPDAPAYRSGVLCLDGVEISTSGGHYVAIDMPAAPYPLAGEPRDIVEDVRRLGGFGIAAHPDSPKGELRWRGWDTPFDAVELVNPDTSWRVYLRSPEWRPRLHLFASIVDYPFRPTETLASLVQRPSDVLRQWSDVTRTRRVVGLAGTDAHAKIAWRNADPGENRWSLPLPSYEASFEMLSVHVRPERPLTGTAATDAELVMRAIRSGHAYIAIDGLASPPAFEFSAANARGDAREGDELEAGAGPVTLRVRSNAPPAFTTIVWDGARIVSADHDKPEITVQAPGTPAEYRVEIQSTGRGLPTSWILSNPIYVRGPAAAGQPAPRPPAATSAAIFDGTINGWRVEHDSVSLAALDVSPTIDGSELRLRYALAGDAQAGGAGGPFIAVRNDRPTGLASSDRLTFSVRAEHPMRISVQLRPDRQGGVPQRWQRSVYVDTVDREQTVYFDDLTPIGLARTPRPPLSEIHDIMFVIDTANTKPGSSGRLWIKRPAVQSLR